MKCDLVCPKNAKTFVARIREVGGLDLNDVGRAPATAISDLPQVVPLVYHGFRRTADLSATAIAVPLEKMFSHRTGEAKFRDHAELSQRFRTAQNAKLVVFGVAIDQPLEDYWSIARARHIQRSLAELRPALVSTPNFSLFNDVPRWDNLHSMKRIALCWFELANTGIPTALHVNARTERDWQSWGEFLKRHTEIGIVSYEFKTGAATAARGNWHARHISRLPELAERPLRLIVRGGSRHLRQFARSFSAVAFVSPDPFIRAMKRRRLVWRWPQKPRWIREKTDPGQSLDDLLQHNVALYSAMVLRRSFGHVDSAGVDVG